MEGLDAPTPPARIHRSPIPVANQRCVGLFDAKCFPTTTEYLADGEQQYFCLIAAIYRSDG
jgi:hypothetical protein